MGRILGRSCPTRTWWHGSSCTVYSSFSRKKNHRKASILRIFDSLSVLSESGSIWQGSKSKYATMINTTSSGASLTFQMLGTMKNFATSETGYLHWGQGIFKWLVSIRSSHLIYRFGDVCYLEPYVPSRFARQFGYDQLYVGNPNSRLAFMGRLINGAWSWRYFWKNT